MLDENLPTFYFKPSSDNPRTTTIFLSQNGSELQPEYSQKRPDPSLPASKNCYGLALYDSYNPEVLFAEVLVQPDWQAPTLSQAEIRSQNGVPPPPVPIVPEKFVVQLYNPDQQVMIKQIPGKGMSSAHWEFEMPQTSFRQPSVASIDRVQNDPTISEATPKIAFKWKRDGKLSKDISCFMAGKNTDGRRQKEPDILCAMLKGGNLTLYQPNMGRVDVEDMKGLEVVLLLGSSVIKDIYFNPNREMFNIGPSQPQKPDRKNSGQAISGKSSSAPPPPPSNHYTPPLMSGAGYAVPPPSQQSSYPPPPPLQQPQYQPQNIPTRPHNSPPPIQTQTQARIDAETARLRAEEAKERAKIEARDQKKIKKMLEAEERERLRKEAEIEKETERLRKQYGMPSQSPPRVSFTSAPTMPPRPSNGYQPQSYGRPPGLHAYQSAPHSQPVPVQRPLSTPNGVGNNASASASSFNLSSVCNLVQSGISSVSQHAHGSGHGSGSGSTSTGGRLGRLSGGMAGNGSSPYLQAPGQGTASSSGFFGLGGKNKIQKKRSVYF